MRILFVCNEYPPTSSGGIGIFVKSIAEALVEKGWVVYVHCMHPSYGETQWKLIQGVNVFEFKRSNIGNVLINEFTSRWAQSSSVKRIVRSHNIDIVESYEWSGPLILHPGVPLVVRLHGGNYTHALYENKRASKLLKFFERRGVSIADFVVSVSKHIAGYSKIAYRVENDVNVIYNFYDSKKFFPDQAIERDFNLIIFVGKFHERKGVHEMFDRIIELLVEFPSFKFKFIGEYKDSEKRSVVDKMAPLVARRIEFLGKVAHVDLAKFYQKAAFTLVPSRAEAFGLVAVEAMACGSIVIMADGHVSSELITHAENGFRINYRKENTLLDLFQNQLSRNKILEISSRAISGAQKFEKDTVLEENVLMYKKLINS